MFECFHCGERSVVWDNDFSFEDFCLEGEGIVHVCHCGNCGAYIQYQVPCDDLGETTATEEADKEGDGRWIPLDDCMSMCSKCGSLGCGSKYCPSCGAKMEGAYDGIDV